MAHTYNPSTEEVKTQDPWGLLTSSVAELGSFRREKPYLKKTRSRGRQDGSVANAPAAKPANLSSITRNHMVDREIHLLQTVFSFPLSLLPYCILSLPYS